MNRFYLVDKPEGISSFDVIRNLRKKLNIKKMWHTGTLDPLASGCLLIATWNYTKLIPYLEKDTKEYEFTISLDWTSDSFDLWTKVTYLSESEKKKFKSEITKDKLDKVMKEKFTWKILQTPPKYSALKINWQRAYKKARAWDEFEIEKRQVEIFNIEILSYKYPELKLKAKVSAWTYIRSIAMDLWDFLKTKAYISYLRRTKIWPLNIDKWIVLDEIDESKYISESELFEESRFISFDENMLKRLANWLDTNIDLQIADWIYFVKNDWKITNIVSYKDGVLKPLKMIL